LGAHLQPYLGQRFCAFPLLRPRCRQRLCAEGLESISHELFPLLTLDAKFSQLLLVRPLEAAHLRDETICLLSKCLSLGLLLDLDALG
jgi:hypothetical protein